MTTLKELQTLSKAKKKCKRSDDSVSGLYWRISATGTVSAAYRTRAGKGEFKVFRANMQLNSTAFTEVRKKAIEMELRVFEGKSPFEEQEQVVEITRYTIGQYHILFRKDRPAELSVKHRKLKREKSVARDNQCMRWLLAQEVGYSTTNKPILFSDVYIDDPRIPSLLDQIIARTVKNKSGTGNMEKSLNITKQMFKNARRNKIIEDNPLEDFFWTPPPSKRAKDIPVDVLNLIIIECRKYARGEGVYRDKRWKRIGLLFEFKMLMGMRVAEALPMRKDWIDFSDNSITVPENMTKTEEEYRFTFTESIADILRRSPAWDEPHNQLVFGINNKICHHYDKEWHVILDQTGVMGSVAELVNEKRRLYKNGESTVEKSKQITELKKTRYRGHDTRHAFATDQMRSAVTNGLVMSERDQIDVLKQIGKGLQHKDIKTTKHYVRPDDEIQRQMVANRQAALNQVLGSAE